MNLNLAAVIRPRKYLPCAPKHPTGLFHVKLRRIGWTRRRAWINRGTLQLAQSSIPEKFYILFAIDCGPDMHQCASDGESPFLCAIKCASSTLQNKIISSGGDSVGVVLYNTVGLADSRIHSRTLSNLLASMFCKSSRFQAHSKFHWLKFATSTSRERFLDLLEPFFIQVIFSLIQHAISRVWL